jgi:hypothetical protein
MKQSHRNRYLQLAKELKHHLQDDQYFNTATEKAFLRWYARAQFGDKVSENAQYFDESGDGGIDVIIQTASAIYVCQMKYDRSINLSIASKDDVKKFALLAEVFQNPDKTDFDNWLKTVKETYHRAYIDARSVIQKGEKEVHFYFVTTKRSPLNSDTYNGVEIQDCFHTLILWDLFSSLLYPPSKPLVIPFDQHFESAIVENQYKTFMGLVDVQVFLKAMDSDQAERLFAQNVRSELPHSTVNQEIRHTYEKEPNNFWLGHNGVYITCKRIDKVGSNQFKLNFPSIINGSQTLHAIYASRVRHQCKILVRVLETGIDDTSTIELMSSVIRWTNKQNNMKYQNLFAHDSYQINIARFLIKLGIFYERREREWIREKKIYLPGYISISIKDLAQWLGVQYDSIGLGTVRNQVYTLFHDQNYLKIFGSFDESFDSVQYEIMLVLIWSAQLLKYLIRESGPLYKSYMRISQYVLLRMIFDVIMDDKRLFHGVLKRIKPHNFGKNSNSRELAQTLHLVIKQFKKIQSSEAEKNPRVDFSNFFKRNDLIRYAYDKVLTKQQIAKIHAGLVSVVQP